MANTTWVEKIRGYLSARGPQLLSTLGEQLDPEERPSGKLYQALVGSGINIKRVGVGPKFYAYLDGQESAVDALCEGKSERSEAYKRSVLIAFCKQLEDGFMIGLNIQTGKYVISEDRSVFDIKSADRGEFDRIIPIENKFRHAGLDIDDLTEMDRSTLNSSIEAWCQEHGINKSSLMREIRSSFRIGAHASLAKLLETFLEAQPRDIRHKVNIPGAILEQLLLLSK